ncbi:hypothetical protein ACKFKH_16150 [Phormidesmis sp. 146-20]
MKSEVITATIAATIAAISTIVSIYSQTRVAELTDRLAKQRGSAFGLR